VRTLSKKNIFYDYDIDFFLNNEYFGPRRLVAFFEIGGGGIGGAEKVFVQYLDKLCRESNWYVSVLVGGKLSATIQSRLRLWAPNLELQEVPWRKRSKLFFSFALPIVDWWHVWNLYRKFHSYYPDIILVNQPSPEDAQGALRAAFSIPAKLVSLVHQAPAGILPMFLQSPRIRYASNLYANVHKIMAVSNACKTSLTTYYGVPNNKVAVVWNGVTDVKTELSDERKTDLRKQYAIGPDDVVALWVGRVSQEKGLDVLLEAIRKGGQCLHTLKVLLSSFLFWGIMTAGRRARCSLTG
jgi:glycosyltransferase involved in cell wall biosynthesis